MIINVRGTSGSGKSWVVKELMKQFSVSPYDAERLGHVLNGNTFVLGPYLSGLSTEGTDVVNRKTTQEGIQKLIERAGGGVDDLSKNIRDQDNIQKEIDISSFQNVIFESLLVSGIYGRYRDQARRVTDFRWVFLNTSLEKCLENIRNRRIKAKKPAEFNPDATINKYRSVRSILNKARADGLKTWDISSDEAVELIAEWIA